MSFSSRTAATLVDEVMYVSVDGASTDDNAVCEATVSRGAAQHGTGECKPCAWFWKEQGCQHGQECGFCHLCPREEIKSRRRAKAASARATAAASMKTTLRETLEAVRVQPPQPLPSPAARMPILELLPRVMPSTPPPALRPLVPPPPAAAPTCVIPPASPLPPPPAADATELLQPLLAGSVEYLAEASLARSASAPATPRDLSSSMYPPLAPPSSPDADLLGKMLADAVIVPPPPGLLPGNLPSIGSVDHGTGRCKPCGWFWKAGGCSNGRECCHCHLCPRGEIHARRRAKIALIRQQKGPVGDHGNDQGQQQNASVVSISPPKEEEQASVSDRQLPTLLGRSRPTPLNLGAELPLPVKVSTEPRTTPVLRLSDRV